MGTPELNYIYDTNMQSWEAWKNIETVEHTPTINNGHQIEQELMPQKQEQRYDQQGVMEFVVDWPFGD